MIKKFAVWDWVVLAVCLFMLPASILLFIMDIFVRLNTTYSVIAADVVWFILSISGLKTKLRKFKEIKTPKSYRKLVMTVWVVFVVILVPPLLSVSSAFLKTYHASVTGDTFQTMQGFEKCEISQFV